MAKQLQDTSSFLKTKKKSSVYEAEPTVQHWEKIHICSVQIYIAFFIVNCPMHMQNVTPAIWLHSPSTLMRSIRQEKTQGKRKPSCSKCSQCQNTSGLIEGALNFINIDLSGLYLEMENNYSVIMYHKCTESHRTF